MHVPRQHGQPSTQESTLAGEPLFLRAVLDSGPNSRNGDETHPLDVAPSQTRGAGTAEDLAGEAKELAEIVLKNLLFGPSPLGKGVWAPWFEERVGQKSDTHLACPFYISQKDKYRSCLTRADPREIKDLKQHLETEHLQPTYCPTCYDTFALARDWEGHIRRGSCMPSGKPRPEGITGLQLQQIARPDDPRMPRELQWPLIWETVFPGVRPPSLAFPSGGIETVIWALRDLWAAAGHQIVLNFLVKRQLRDENINPVTLSSLALDQIIDQVVAKCTQDEIDG
ncbi:hypothetical protein F5Y10DRAFT_288801 [Nemania abortiva]|nr:hypothetical protein F5Y10DRAFT_288801 [Nemania abortiva]